MKLAVSCILRGAYFGVVAGFCPRLFPVYGFFSASIISATSALLTLTKADTMLPKSSGAYPEAGTLVPSLLT
jgi:hypothetical protein